MIRTGSSQNKVPSAALELAVTGIVADVIEFSAIDKLVAQVKSDFGNIDILFANAGVFSPAAIGENTEEIFDTQMAINFKGAVLLLKNSYLLSMMVALSLTYRRLMPIQAWQIPLSMALQKRH